MATKTSSLVEQALKLTSEQKIELIGMIWDSIEASHLPDLTDAQKDELDRRLKLHEQDPSRAIPFEESMKRVHAELERRRRGRKGRANAS